MVGELSDAQGPAVLLSLFCWESILGSEDSAVAETTRTPDQGSDKSISARRWRAAALKTSVVCVVAAVAAVSPGCAAVHSDVGAGVQPSVEMPNSTPVVLSITAATRRIEPSDLCSLMCEAVDEDGDTLTYTWTASQGEVIGEGPSVQWSAPDTEGLFRLSVTVDDGRGGTAESSLSLGVKMNYAPEITELAAFSEVVAPGASTYLKCSASDDDGDPIAYQWEATHGEVFGEGCGVVWLAPAEPGPYWVTVCARDSYGGEATRAIAINVSANTAPDLGRFRVKGVDTDLLDFNDGVWDVFRGRSISIRCVVNDGAAPFTYDWSVDYGTLTAEGDTAVWDAPEEHGPATVIVDVTDVDGSTTRGTVLLYVETCTCAFG